MPHQEEGRDGNHQPFPTWLRSGRTLLTTVIIWPLSGVPSDEAVQSIVHPIAAPPPLFCRQARRGESKGHLRWQGCEGPGAEITHHGYGRASTGRQHDNRLRDGDAFRGRDNRTLVLVRVQDEVVRKCATTDILHVAAAGDARARLLDSDLQLTTGRPICGFAICMNSEMTPEYGLCGSWRGP